ncbi:hypothetical protein [Acidithiobacillus sulfuriphilus]|uniref:hypothetical protein n=1 Tax=Acidithiobacillus sulfuriphilus TaxID=1867749 RepID=UPI003F611854
MEVGFSVYDKEGKLRQTIIEMPHGAYVPQAGDDLIYDELICIIEKRDFEICSASKSYCWSFTAREKS